MGQDNERQRSIDAKIERLRRRLEKITAFPEYKAVLLGLLDLLADEL